MKKMEKKGKKVKIVNSLPFHFFIFFWGGGKKILGGKYPGFAPPNLIFEYAPDCTVF